MELLDFGVITRKNCAEKHKAGRSHVKLKLLRRLVIFVGRFDHSLITLGLGVELINAFRASSLCCCLHAPRKDCLVLRKTI